MSRHRFSYAPTPLPCRAPGCSTLANAGTRHNGLCYACWEILSRTGHLPGQGPTAGPTTSGTLPPVPALTTDDDLDTETSPEIDAEGDAEGDASTFPPVLDQHLYHHRGQTLHVTATCTKTVAKSQVSARALLTEPDQWRLCAVCGPHLLAQAVADPDDDRPRVAVMLTPYRVDEDNAYDWQLRPDKIAEADTALRTLAAESGLPELMAPDGHPATVGSVPAWVVPLLRRNLVVRPGPRDGRVPSPAEAGIFMALDPGIGRPTSDLDDWWDLSEEEVAGRFEGLWIAAEGIAA